MPDIESHETIRAWLTQALCRRLGLAADRIQSRTPFADYGLDSVGAIELHAELEGFLAQPLPNDVLWAHPTLEALAAHLAADRPLPGDAGGAGSGFEAVGRAPEPVAIIGMAVRFPGARTPAAFWEALCDGRDLIGEPPAGRGATGGEPPRAGFLDSIDAFDPQFFSISPREALQMDPAQRLMLELAWEALDDAGIPPLRLEGAAAGVFVGCMWNDYARLFTGKPDWIDQHTATGQDSSITSARVAYTFGLQGPSLTVNTACSSSLVAVHLACQSLWADETSMVLAGGVNLLAARESGLAMHRFGALSPTGRLRAFDADADGYVRGEGGGLVVLKRLSRALADGDSIYCTILGTAVNNDGRSNGLTAPNPAAQEDVLRRAYARAGVAPATVHYVEAHGTGTVLGDPIEAGALGRVLGASRPPGRPLLMGSVKTNIGHLEAAAGIAGLIKTALAVRHGRIPPSLHFERPNPRIAFDELRLRVPVSPTPWPADGLPARAGVSSFGFGGVNCHVVLGESPDGAPSGPRRLTLVFPDGGLPPQAAIEGLIAAEPAFAAAFERCRDAHQRVASTPPGAQPAGDDRPEHPTAAPALDGQPLLFAFQVALAALWRAWGAEPSAVVGRGAGEVAAAHVAGTLALDDAMRLIAGGGRPAAQGRGLPGAAAAVLAPAEVASRGRGRVPDPSVPDAAAEGIRGQRALAEGAEPGPAPEGPRIDTRPPAEPGQAPGRPPERGRDVFLEIGARPLLRGGIETSPEEDGGDRRDPAASDAALLDRLHDCLQDLDRLGISRRPEILPLSARAREALPQSCQALSEWRGDDAALYDICYTASVRRSHLEHRCALVPRSREELRAGLAELARGGLPPGARTGSVGAQPPRLAFVLPGGSPGWRRTAAELCRREPVFRAAWRECEARCRAAGAWPSEACPPGAGPAGLQAPVLALQVALAALWRAWGVRPDAILGFGVGEPAAAHIAGMAGLEAAVAALLIRGNDADAANLRPVAARPGSDAGSGGGAPAAPVQPPGGHPDPQPAAPPWFSGSTGTWMGSPPGGGGRPGALAQAGQVRAAVAAFASGPWDLYLELGADPEVEGELRRCLGASTDGPVLLAPESAAADPREAMLGALADLYTRGFPVAWDAVYHRGGTSLRLPSQPFRRRRFWTDGIQGSEPAAAAPAALPSATAASPSTGMLSYYASLAENRSAERLRFGALREVVPGFSWLDAWADPENHTAARELSDRAIEEIWRRCFQGVDLRAVRRAADIGCGYASDLMRLAAEFPHLELHGINVSAEQLAVAAARLRTAGLDGRVRLFRRDVTRDDPPAEYDLVTTFQVLHHIGDKRAALAHVERSLRNGGLWVAAEIASALASPIDHAASSAHYVPKAEWAEALAESRLRVVSCTDLSREVANFLYDRDFEEHLARIGRRYDETALQHLRGPEALGRMLRANLASYLLLTLQKDELLTRERVLQINRQMLLGGPPASVPADGAAPRDVRQAVIEEVGRVLRLEPAEIDGVRPLGELGLDSMLVLELSRRLEASLGLAVPVTLLYDHPSLDALASELSRRLDTPGQPGRAAPGEAAAAPVAPEESRARLEAESRAAMAWLDRWPGGNGRV